MKAWIIICICTRDTLFPWSLTFQATLLFGISILLYVGFREISSTLEVNKKLLSDYVHTSMLTIIWEGKMSRRSWKSDGVFKLCRKLLYILPLRVAAVWSECKFELAELFHTSCGKKFLFKLRRVTCSAQGLFHRVICQSGPLISNSSPMQVKLID